MQYWTVPVSSRGWLIGGFQLVVGERGWLFNLLILSAFHHTLESIFVLLSLFVRKYEKEGRKLVTAEPETLTMCPFLVVSQLIFPDF